MTTKFSAVIVLLSLLLLVVEMVKRKFAVRTDISRKLAHVGASLIAFATPFFLSKWEIVSICIIFSAVLFYTRQTNFFSSIHSVERKTFGEVFLPIGIALCAFFFLPEEVTAFQFGVLILGISDALAAFVGERFGKHSILLFGSKKSVEGSFAFFVSCLIISSFYVPNIDHQIFAVVFALTLIEFFLVFGLDNVVLPSIGAYLIRFFL